jgi:methylmalonyl-CoA mutase C-terminal domain/subunit
MAAFESAAGIGGRPVRVVVAKVGLDGHERGVQVIARAYRDAGMEVIYTGLRRRPEELAEIVVQEDADVIGLSILSGAVTPLTRAVVEALREREARPLVVVGGIVSKGTRAELAELGVEGVFGPGAPLSEIVEFTVQGVARLRAEEPA